MSRCLSQTVRRPQTSLLGRRLANPYPCPIDNPFAKREEFSSRNLLAYKILTVLSWLLLVIVGVYYTFDSPHDHHRHHHNHTIWGQNNHRRTPFSLNSVIVSIYWVIVLILQAHYVRYLYSADQTFVTSAANVGSHFILVSYPRPPLHSTGLSNEDE